MPISTPSKQPQGILLTPGVGTARRKRVSFGRDVDGQNLQSLGLEPRRTSLTEKLEKSRQLRPKSEPVKQDELDAHWEAVDADRDVTVDLSEPRSQSGQYWKTEYQRYHDEARAEMEKLVKYKQLAKAYAKNKDAESMRLKERLSAEQARVAEMEAKVGELTRQMATASGNPTQNDEVIRDLARQTTLAAQYRGQVKELEALVKKGLDKGDEDGQWLRGVSPRTSQTLMETQRQLKRARDQVQELDGLKNEHKKLRTDARAAEKRAQELEAAKDKTEAELRVAKTQTNELTAKLALAEERAKRKAELLEKLQGDYEKLREESRRTARETRAALGAKDDEIARLKRLLSSDAHVSERASDDLNVPYSVDAPNADWTVDVTQLVSVRKEAKDLTIDSSGWGARIDKLGEQIKVISPRYEPSMTPTQIDKNNFTGRLKLLEKDLYKDTVYRQKAYESPIDRLSRHRSASALAERKAFDDNFTFDVNQDDFTTTLGHSDDLEATPRAKPAINPTEDVQIDLLNDKFARLGAKHSDDSVGCTSMRSMASTLPPGRHAAAVAKLEKRKADRRRRAGGFNKENVRP